ncbi:myosin-4-like isoform X2 [Arachis ipaensis]|uniref:myosin-4-like isoform X2 n=1 Tax=Arachis ipaensis TaxID=130454 RepID=UPI000A2B5EC0|nr:myosin-4-like isoform X2 [Arachis ipaensis]
MLNSRLHVCFSILIGRWSLMGTNLKNLTWLNPLAYLFRQRKGNNFFEPHFPFSSKFESFALIMSIQPKTEPGSPPILSSTSNKSWETMSIPELIQILRIKWQKEYYDRVEEVLVAREEKLKTKVGQLEEKFQVQSLATIDAEKVQGLYEALFKEVKESGLDKETIENLRKKNKELECENRKLLELKNKCEVDGNAVDELRKKVAELEAEKKNNLDTTTELNDENGKLVDEKIEDQPIARKKNFSLKRKRAEIDTQKNTIVDLINFKVAGKKISLGEIEKFIKNQKELHGYKRNIDPLSMWSEHFPFMLMADEYGQCSTDVKLVHDVDDVGIAQYLQVIGGRLLSIGRTQELKHASDTFDKKSMEKLMQENLEKEKKFRVALEQIELKDEKMKGLMEKMLQLEEKEKKLDEDKVDLQTKVMELTMEKKSLETDKENHGFEMFIFGFDRAVEQVRFIAPTLDFAVMDPCKVVINGQLVDDDQDQESESEDVAVS